VIRAGLAVANAFQPDVILAIGGGSPMDAAKIMWVMYEHPEVHFADLALRYMDIRKRIYRFPKMGVKAILVAVPTTSGTGSEVTPFAVVTDEATGVKYPIADYQLTPTMAVIDANLVMHLPKKLSAYGGIDAVAHAIEAYVSVMANEYTDGQALQALKLLKEYLPSAYLQGANAPQARERVHNAATIAGIAFANAFLGVCHSMAHSLGAAFHLSHGLAIALLLPNVIRYNAADIPLKQTAYSQYDRPQGVRRYAQIARHLGLNAEHDHQCAAKLIVWIEELKTTLEIPDSIAAAGINETDFLARLDGIAEAAFDDQCSAANPRFPLIAELRQMLLDSYYGQAFQEIDGL
jgi:acetaldehyde dehydrogenase/alcohol dehydrogenase